jgi:molybdopterin-guanine dinucleotide biosynthesis protein A
MLRDDVAAAILVGGEGRRMGGARKPLLVVEGQCVLARQLTVLERLFAEIVLLGDASEPFARFGRRVLVDPVPGRGPLPAIAAALRTLRRPLFVVAGDMPFLDETAVVLTVQRVLVAGADVAVPRVGGHPEPLHACYRPSCLPALEQALEHGQLQVSSVYSAVRVVWIEEQELRQLDPALGFLRNINTPEALDAP